MEALITKVKTILWIIDNNYDAYLAEIMPMLLTWAEGECNQIWTDEAGEPVNVPSPVVLFIARAAEYNLLQAGLNSESLGDWSVSYYTDEFPESVTKWLQHYKRVRW